MGKQRVIERGRQIDIERTMSSGHPPSPVRGEMDQEQRAEGKKQKAY